MGGASQAYVLDVKNYNKMMHLWNGRSNKKGSTEKCGAENVIGSGAES